MAGIQEYKCPSCGGAIGFDSSIQKMKCPYCDTEFEMDALAALDDVLQNEMEDELNWNVDSQEHWEDDDKQDMKVYVCNSCGGEIIGDSNMAASSCPFCDNPVVVMSQFQGMLKPNYVIPFKLDKKTAVEGLKKHLLGKRLLPKVFKDQNHLEEIRGIYVPYWLFDAKADAGIRYKGIKVTTWSDSRYRYTRESFYSIVRKGTLEFEKIPVDGSTKMADDLMESLEPYDYSALIDFQTAYLAGYLADKFDVTAQECTDRANERARASVEDAFRDTVEGYTTVIPEHTGIQVANGSVKYALFPVWILNTKWKDKKYTFAMNGQTGKFVGNLPLDKGAYFKYLCLFTAIIAAISFVVLRFILRM